jgi:hypothetical protein
MILVRIDSKPERLQGVRRAGLRSADKQKWELARNVRGRHTRG